MKRIFFVASLATLGLLSCTEAPTGTAGRGDLSLEVVAVTVAPSGGSAEASAAAAPEAAGVAAPLTAPSRVGPITVDSARIVLSGPESRTIRATPGTDVTISNLPIGSYTAVLEGWGGDELVYGGTVSNIQVTGGTSNSVTQVLFAPTRLEFIAINETVQLTTPAGTSWSSGNGSIASISAAGVLTAKANGAAAITGTLGSSTVQVLALVAQQVDSVEVTPANPTIAPGATQQFTATAFDSLGTQVTGVSVLWVSSNHNVATVNQSGLASGVGYGTVAITATVRGQPASTALSVSAGAPAGLRVRGLPGQIGRLEVFDSLRVEIVDAGGNVVATATDSVTIAIGANPNAGALFGVTRVKAVAGVATFSPLRVTRAGPSYTLVASSGALPPDTSRAFDVGGVALFANANYQDYIVGNSNSETSNLQDSFKALGLEVNAFNSLDFSGELADAWILAIGELTADLSAALTPSARNSINNFVSNGGTLIVHMDGLGRFVTLLNATFGFTMGAPLYPGGTFSRTAAANGTPFAGGPNTLASPSATGVVDDALLPGGSLVMYAQAGTNDAAVAVIPYINGQIIIMGWDWFSAPPTGTTPTPADGIAWLEVLGRATRY